MKSARAICLHARIKNPRKNAGFVKKRKYHGRRIAKTDEAGKKHSQNM